MSNTVKIRKGNKVRFVEVGRLDSFLQQGFEQIDDNGNVIQRATGGSVVPIARYNQLLDEVEKLKKENVALKSENTRLKKSADK